MRFPSKAICIRTRRRRRRALKPHISLLLICLLPSCAVVKRTAEVPGDTVRMISGNNKNQPQPTDPAELQQELFRFADDFIGMANDEYSRLIREWPNAPEMALRDSRLEMNYRILEIASGPNAYANLVDMLFAVTLARYFVENYWLPDKPGELSRPTLLKLQASQKKIVALASESLSKEEGARLQANILDWLEHNAQDDLPLYARYPGLLSELLETDNRDSDQPNSLFGVLMLDPLAGLDPTVREITQTRLFAERAMYVSQRMPKVLRLEMELFNRRLLDTPEIAGALDDAERLTRSIEEAAAVATELPDRVTREREALVQTLREEREGLNQLVVDTEDTLLAAALALEKVDTVIHSTDQFLARFDSDDPAAPEPSTSSEEPGEPFRIQDYTTAAKQLAETSEQLNQLVLSLDKVLATATSEEVQTRIDAASQAAVSRSEELINYAFVRAVWLLVIACLLTLLTLALKRRFFKRPQS